MASSFETLVFEIIAKDRDASAAFARFRRQVDDTSRSVDKSSASLDKNAQALDKNKAHATSALSALIGVGSALAPISAGAVAAGAGFSAFAALAVPSVMKVSTALSDKGGGLAAQWMILDNRQRNAALGVQALGGKYQGLAHAMEPRTFQVFNTGLALANSLLGPTAKLASGAGAGVESFLVQFSQRAGLQQFITAMAGLAGPAFASLGSDITHIAHAVFQLLQSFAGPGLLELRMLNGVFVTLDTSITFLSQHAPALTSVALTVGGLALALSKLGLLSGVLKITGIASIATQMTGFAAATRGATVAERGMLATTTALEAITPFGWAVLGAAALGGLVFWLSRFKSSTDTAITTIERQNKAAGFNTTGYYTAAAALGKYNQANEQASVTVMNLHTGMVTGTTTVGKMTGATAQLTAAQKKLVTEGGNQQTFLTTLENKYNLTRGAAVSLATHAGVLASDVNKGGTAMKDATAKAEAYANANLKAQHPTSQLAQDMQDFANQTLTATQRTKALMDALKLFFNPAVTADQDTITLVNDQVALNVALKASGGSTGLLTQKQRDARGAFDTYISQVATTASDAFNATGKTSSYTSVINKSLPALKAAAGHNKTLRQEIQNLIDTERRIPKSEHTIISVRASGTLYSTNPGTQAALHKFGLAGGGKLPGFGGGDRHLRLLESGEAVVDKYRTQRYAPVLKAMGVPGMAGGGLVSGHYSDGPGGAARWLGASVPVMRTAETALMGAALGKLFGQAMTAAQAAAMAGSGGPGVARWAPLILRALAMLGQSSANLGAVEHRMAQESGGNPYAINNWDINARMGDPSRGLMQTIMSTFLRYRSWSLPNNIYDPLANIYAGLNYAEHAYPGRSLSSVMLQAGGYDQGGYLPPGLSLAYNGTGRPEPVGGGNVTYNIHVSVPVSANQAETGRAIVSAIRQHEKRSGAGWRK